MLKVTCPHFNGNVRRQEYPKSTTNRVPLDMAEVVVAVHKSIPPVTLVPCILTMRRELQHPKLEIMTVWYYQDTSFRVNPQSIVCLNVTELLVLWRTRCLCGFESCSWKPDFLNFRWYTIVQNNSPPPKVFC